MVVNPRRPWTLNERCETFASGGPWRYAYGTLAHWLRRVQLKERAGYRQEKMVGFTCCRCEGGEGRQINRILCALGTASSTKKECRLLFFRVFFCFFVYRCGDLPSYVDSPSVALLLSLWKLAGEGNIKSCNKTTVSASICWTSSATPTSSANPSRTTSINKLYKSCVRFEK